MKRFFNKVRDKVFLNAIRRVVREELHHQHYHNDEISHSIVQFAMDRFMKIRDKRYFSHNFKTKEDFETFCSENETSFIHDSELGMLAKVQFSKTTQIYKYPGFCSICNKEVDFICDSSVGTHIEGLLCPDCRQNVRLRMMYNTVLSVYREGMRVYASEYLTVFFNCLQKVISNLIGSEYLAPDDERRKTIRHEDITNLSFGDESLDLYISNDVLEHVFDYKAAFKEAYRVLAHDGKFLFHAPFHYRNKETVIRAKLNDMGGVLFLKKPVYHGDPTKPDEGCLCVNDFGWDILPELEMAGFKNVYATLTRDLRQGFMGRAALVFTAEK